MASVHLGRAEDAMRDRLRPFVEREHAAVAIGVRLDCQVEGGAGLQLPEEVHHAGVAREHLEHHLVIANVAPAASIVQMSPDDPDRILVAVEGLESPHDAGRLVEFHLLDDPVELFGLLAWGNRQLLLRECERTGKQE